jgi:hypothetical protein
LEDWEMNPRLLRTLVATLALALLAAKAPAGKHFATPEEAAQALVSAVKADNTKALLALLGPAAKGILHSGDPVADREGRERFVSSYEEKNSIQKVSDTEVLLTTGKDDWPMPIPLVKDASGWRFDTKAGEQEILARRIGRNELDTIQSSLAYVDAQREYYARDPDQDALLHYAQHIVSTKGKRDGLYWETGPDEPESPLGSLFASARAEGYGEPKRGSKPTPYHGYYYRILKAQGPHAEGGAYDYLAKGEMMGGFALVAYPAVWGSSGVMTFQVNHDGVVYEKDLGPKTAEIAKAMKTFDPDETWKPVSEADKALPSE